MKTMYVYYTFVVNGHIRLNCELSSKDKMPEILEEVQDTDCT